MAAVWATEELRGVDFGDERLDKRAARLLTSLGRRPNFSIPAACGGHAETQAAYRFFDNDKVTFEAVLSPHLQQTQKRMAAQNLVLLVQDTTEIVLSRPTQPVKGAGELDGSRQGLLLHEQQAFTPEGTPLGTVDAQVIIRQTLHRDVDRAKQNSDASRRGAEASRRERCLRTPLEQKESVRWINGLRRARQVAAQMPGTRCVSVADSDADMYEWFAEPRTESADPPTPAVDWIVRACHDRSLNTEADHLRAAVLATPVLYKKTVKLRARQVRVTIKKQKRQRQRQRSRRSRTAKVQVRAATLTLRPPWRQDMKLPPVTVNVVLVSEAKPPAGEPPVEWILITTLPVATLEQVRAVVKYYCVRWNIEVLFRTLKSGCRIEQRRFEAIDRVLPCLALYLIVAWRTQFVCRLSREYPDADCQMLLDPSEWKSVWVATQRCKPPKKPPTLKRMVRLIAGLGGYIDGPGRDPGAQTVWIGLQRMYDLTWAWNAFGPK